VGLAFEHVGPMYGRGRVETAARAIEEPVDDVPLLRLGRGFV
jgi:hypothetical protein